MGSSEGVDGLAIGITGLGLVFLSAGVIGIIAPVRPLQVPSGAEEIPIVEEFQPPDPAPPAVSPAAPSEPTESVITEPRLRPPPVVNVASADAPVLFAVPAVGRVVPLAQADAPPPRVAPRAAPQAVVATPAVATFEGAGSSGDFPYPEYPREAVRNHWQGRLLLYTVVGANGLPERVEVRESSGHAMLDNAALEVVRRRWVWPIGTVRHFHIPFHFQLEK